MANFLSNYIEILSYVTIIPAYLAFILFMIVIKKKLVLADYELPDTVENEQEIHLSDEYYDEIDRTTNDA